MSNFQYMPHLIKPTLPKIKKCKAHLLFSVNQFNHQTVLVMFWTGFLKAVHSNVAKNLLLLTSMFSRLRCVNVYFGSSVWYSKISKQTLIAVQNIDNRKNYKLTTELLLLLDWIGSDYHVTINPIQIEPNYNILFNTKTTQGMCGSTYYLRGN